MTERDLKDALGEWSDVLGGKGEAKDDDGRK